mgnify:CR=1 FL=1|tara:strand:+ start:37 stop:771 length:735 start_codon:yes stop_codon:yes gene_type:complete
MGFKNYLWDEAWELNVSRGKVRGASTIHKFGATPSQSTNTTATIWDKEDTLYPWSAFDTAGVLVAAQVGADDNGKVVTIVGLDSNWDIIEEDFTLSSAGTVTGTKTFKRVYRGYVKTGDTNVGQLNFSRGGTQVLRITAGLGQTLMSIYTVPNGYTGYLYQGVCSAQSGADATGFMMIRYNTVGQAFRVGHTFEVSGDGGEYFYKFAFPQEIPEKSDIDLRLTTRSNNGRYTAAFDILLIKNEL